MATAKKKTTPRKVNSSAARSAKSASPKQVVAVKPDRAKKPAAKSAKQPEQQYSTRVQALATAFALLCVVFATMAYTNY
jgi:hypothetical protein